MPTSPEAPSARDSHQPPDARPPRWLTRAVAASVLAGACAVAPLGASPAAAQNSSYDLVSARYDGGHSAGQYSYKPVTMSTDARYVSFRSDSSTLVENDTNGQPDLFVRDRQTGTTERVNVSDTGAIDPGQYGSYMSRISGGGRHVVFSSYSPMTADDTNSNRDGDPNSNVDAYLRDLDAGTTERISVGPDGQPGNQSAGGGVDVSADGRFVVFGGGATNWGVDASYGAIWLRDRQADTTTLIHAGSSTFGHVGGARISDDGNVVSFVNSTPNVLNRLYAFDRRTGELERVDVRSDETPGNAYHVFSHDLSSDGNVIAFEYDDSLIADDTNGSNHSDVYVRDRAAGTTRIASVSSSGAQSPNAASDVVISGNGRFVGFTLWHWFNVPGWDPGTDAYVHDLQHGSTWQVAPQGYGTTTATGGDLDSSGLRMVINASHTAEPFSTSQGLYVATRPADTTAPILRGWASPGPNGSGWNSTPVDVTWDAYDPYPSWGPASVPPATSVTDEGEHTVTAESCDKAGNCTPGEVPVKIDLTDPAAAVTAPADGATFTYGSAQRAAYTCSDAGSGVASCTGTVANGDRLDTSTVGTHQFTVTATDRAGRQTTVTRSYAVAAGVPSAPFNVAGGAGDAKAIVSWTPPRTNGGSAITGYTVTASPGGKTVRVDGTTTSAIVTGLTNDTAYTFAVTATNAIGTSRASTASAPVTPKAAAAPPTSVTGTVDPAVGGTVTTDAHATGPTGEQPLTTSVTVPAGATGDTVSIAQTTVTVPAPTGYSFLGQQVDISAPVATADSPLVISFRLDASTLNGLTPSQIELSRAADGTTVSTIVPDCIDPSAEVADPDPCMVSDWATDGSGDVVLTAYTSHASHWDFATKGDTTGPQVTVTSPNDKSSATYGSSVPVTYSCADDAGGSGMASCTATLTAGGTTKTVSSGAKLDTTVVGTHTLTVTAVDKAGNRSTKTATSSVVWPFTGYFAPVASTGPSSFKAGSTVPMNFSLGGDRGTSILVSGAPVSYPVNCSTGERTGTDAASTGMLTYDKAAGRYSYAWQSGKAWSGTCRVFELGLKDGTKHPATVKFGR